MVEHVIGGWVEDELVQMVMTRGARIVAPGHFCGEIFAGKNGYYASHAGYMTVDDAEAMEREGYTDVAIARGYGSGQFTPMEFVSVCPWM